jgi:hypothetical protein
MALDISSYIPGDRSRCPSPLIYHAININGGAATAGNTAGDLSVLTKLVARCRSN